MVSGISEYDAQEFRTLLNFEEGPHKKHAAERRIWVPNQNLGTKPEFALRLRVALIQLTGRSKCTGI